MNHGVRPSILATLLACTAAPRSAAQAGASADTTGGKSNVVPVVEITGFLTLLSVYDRFAYANAVQDGKKVSARRSRSSTRGFRFSVPKPARQCRRRRPRAVVHDGARIRCAHRRAGRGPTSFGAVRIDGEARDDRRTGDSDSMIGSGR